ncbi:hypothetical protein [Calothrix sp. NIES-3974]|uniref:hypothetical protein n=1 Tax=Calothrix sp. NIES-3974 TaxID=2005462 RepID=UPI000BBC43B1|nr:hypothetical protein [Calothrix sp. NIES-3974]
MADNTNEAEEDWEFLGEQRICTSANNRGKQTHAMALIRVTIKISSQPMKHHLHKLNFQLFHLLHFLVDALRIRNTPVEKQAT